MSNRVENPRPNQTELERNSTFRSNLWANEKTLLLLGGPVAAVGGIIIAQGATLTGAIIGVGSAAITETLAFIGAKIGIDLSK